MDETKTCGNCKFFGAWSEKDDLPPDYRLCERVPMIAQYYTGDREVAPTNEPAVVIDSSGYYAALCVKSDFACNLHEPL